MPRDDTTRSAFDNSVRVLEVSRELSVPQTAQAVLDVERIVSLTALLMRVEQGDASKSVSWLEAFAEYWSESGKKRDDPWGALLPLPLVVVDSARLDAQSKGLFREWGVTSFIEGESASELQRTLERTLFHAREHGCFSDEISQSEFAIERANSQQMPDPDVYAAALQALNAIEDLGTERED